MITGRASISLLATRYAPADLSVGYEYAVAYKHSVSYQHSVRQISLCHGNLLLNLM
jgi:hypothetical protein